MRSLFPLAILALSPLVAFAQEVDPSKDNWESKSATYSRSVGALSYKVTPGYVAVRNNQSNEVECNMFYCAYTKDGADSTKRPLAFVFNGGPGSATMWLHMGGLAPVMAKLNDDGTMSKPPFGVQTNPDSWLEFTDLVFVDAPGTGLSRMVKSDNKRFFGVQGDLEAFTIFIKTFLNNSKRWRSPLFLVGESYGGIRGGGLSKSLLDRGIALSGLVVVSGTMNFGTLDGTPGNDLNHLAFLPTYAATAWYHKRLPARLQSKPIEAVIAETEKWMHESYAPALFRGDQLSEAEKRSVAKRLSEFTGLKEEWLLRANLRVREFNFFKELLRYQGLTVGRLDGRITSREADGVAATSNSDPSGDTITPSYVSSLHDYYSRDLNWPGFDKNYPTYGNVYPWDWGVNGGGFVDTSTMFRDALSQNKHMKVLFCEGYFDMACPFYGMRYTVDHMNIDPETKKNIEWAYYPAGHMMYIEKGSRLKLKRDVQSFFARTLQP